MERLPFDRTLQTCAQLALAVALAATPGLAAAQTVDVELAVDSVSDGTLCSGVNDGPIFCDAGPLSDSEVTVTWSLASATSLNGYDFTVSWDAAELTLLSCTPLFPAGSASFLVSPCSAADPAGSDAVALSLVAASTTDLFSMTFQVAGSLDVDCDDDVGWLPNGSGLSPTGVTLGNPSGSSIDLAVVAKCSDGVDNDGDGTIDFDGGVCAGLPPGSQTAPDSYCTSFERNREKQKSGCGLGLEAVLALAPWLAWRRRAAMRGTRSIH